MNEPTTPQEFARSIGRQLDKGDQLMANFYIKKFSILFPREYAQFLPVMKAEVMKRKS